MDEEKRIINDFRHSELQAIGNTAGVRWVNMRKMAVRCCKCSNNKSLSHFLQILLGLQQISTNTFEIKLLGSSVKMMFLSLTIQA